MHRSTSGVSFALGVDKPGVMLYIDPMSQATNTERATMTTDPREIPQTREEKLAQTSTMYSTANMKGTDGVTSYFTKEIDKDQAAERLALPALWETFSYDRTTANFDAYRDAYLAVNGSFPYDHLRPVVAETAIRIGFANAGLKVHQNARCGMTRNNRVHNTPHLIEGDLEAKFTCRRCGGPTIPATNETIEVAWQDTYRQSKRSPWGGMDEAYTVTQMMEMQNDLAERQSI